MDYHAARMRLSESKDNVFSFAEREHSRGNFAAKIRKRNNPNK
jgi:hypothetical protein